MKSQPTIGQPQTLTADMCSQTWGMKEIEEKWPLGKSRRSGQT
ncbi:hypothetical protein [Prevotella corporis]|nr:hypothetical protein [Prevotella corporis]